MIGDLQIVIRQVDNGTVMHVRETAEAGGLKSIEQKVYTNTDDLLERLRILLAPKPETKG